MTDDLKERLEANTAVLSKAGFVTVEGRLLVEARDRIAALEAQSAAHKESAQNALDEVVRERTARHSLEAQLAEARKALEFYRDSFQFHPKRSATGINLSTWLPKSCLLEDCGETARAFLNPKDSAS
jgi:hypothetical protein